MTDSTRQAYLEGYEFALRNLSDEAVQGDLARIRAASGAGSPSSAGFATGSDPAPGRESGVSELVDADGWPILKNASGDDLRLAIDAVGKLAVYGNFILSALAGIYAERERNTKAAHHHAQLLGQALGRVLVTVGAAAEVPQTGPGLLLLADDYVAQMEAPQ